MATKDQKPESTGMYTAGMVCGIVGVVFSFIPGISWIGLILGIIALVFGIIGLVKKAGGGKSITATVLGGISVLISIIVMIVVANTINQAVNVLTDGVSGTIDSFLEDYESDALGKTVDVQIEGWQEIDDFWSDEGLVVTIKNISDKTLSFSVNIEALDASGNRIDESYVSADSLAPGQSVTDNAFTLSKLDADTLSKATFRIYRVTSY